MTCTTKLIPGDGHATPQYTLTPRHVHAHATQLLQKHVRLRDHGPKCRAWILWTCLFYAASRITSLAAACAALRDAPSDTAAHDALLATLPNDAPSCNAASTAPCKATCPTPYAAAVNRWPST